MPTNASLAVDRDQPIDLSVNKRPINGVDRFQPDPIIVIPGVPELPEFSLYSLADQIADKLCAMCNQLPTRNTK
jgi:hypothetical protein